MIRLFLYILLILILTGCREESRQPAQLQQCINCHALKLDVNHQLSCTTCHQGNNEAKDKDAAHLQLIARPAHPDVLKKNCGVCHAEIVADTGFSEHFTLKNSTNNFREVFGATKPLDNFLEVQNKIAPETPLDLADDLLRRRCFQCHPYSSGDNYPAIKHGVGCSACHLPFYEGKLTSHKFQKPQDQQCLSCHYGNYVGFDYYGRFEHDYNFEYRTPFTTKNDHFRPYGVEYHQLTPDIHQQKGLGCVDCHTGPELMGQSSAKPSCEGCHSPALLEISLPPQVENRHDAFLLHGSDGREHPLPLMQNSAHFNMKEKISCMACHAQWTFNDFGKHYLRSDSDDVEPWTLLATQGSHEVEAIVERNSDFHTDDLPIEMTDKITGRPFPGLWFKGFNMRRWEKPILGRDKDGTITPMRPLLDYSLSWVDEEGKVHFDSVKASDIRQGLRPYVPHTTGAAGVFYMERLDSFLDEERSSASQ